MQKISRLLVGAFLFSGVLFGIGCSQGCVSTEMKTQATLNEVRVTRMVELIGAGQTTREQEQAFIKADAAAWTTFREALGAPAAK